MGGPTHLMVGQRIATWDVTGAAVSNAGIVDVSLPCVELNGISSLVWYILILSRRNCGGSAYQRR